MSNEHEVLLDNEKQNEPEIKVERREGEPTGAFKGAAWAALVVGVGAYFIGLFNAKYGTERKRILLCRFNLWTLFISIFAKGSKR